MRRRTDPAEADYDSERHAGPAPVWMIEALHGQREEFLAAHGRLRQDIEQGFLELRNKFDAHESITRELQLALNTIATERRVEKEQLLKRGTWAGILAAAGLTGALEVIKHWAGRP